MIEPAAKGLRPLCFICAVPFDAEQYEVIKIQQQ
jgi:hypothetical protein